MYVKDTINIAEQDEIAEILKADVELVNQDIKISYNKVLSKCEALVRIMYLTEDGRINKVEGKIPAVGFIDMPNISEENICDVNNEISNIIIRPNSAEEHSIYVEIELETSCRAYEKKELMLIQDLYSTICDLDFSQKKVITTTEKVNKNKNFTVTSKTNIPELENGTLLDTQTICAINKEQVSDSELICEGEITVNFIFANENNTINSKVSKIPFEVSIENPISNENSNVETKMDIINTEFNVKTNGDVDCSIDAQANAEFSRNESINIIDNIEIEENDADSGDYDSLIIYIVQKGDTLWKIAKKFKTTVDSITRVNGIEDTSKIDVGQKLYIPKFKTYIRRGNVDAVSA